MDITQFSKTVQPNARKSCLTRYETEIRELRKNGYGLQQIQNFLSLNGVNTSIPNISRFLKRKQPVKQENETLKESNDSTNTNIQAEIHKTPNQPKPPLTGSHDPRALDRIFRSKPDLEALSRIAKKNRAEK